MAGQASADRVAAQIQAQGESMTLRRPGSPNVDVVLKGKRYNREGGAQGGELAGAGAIRQAEFYVKISNAEIAAASWPGPPRSNDVLIIGGRHYRLQGDADTRKGGDVVAMHILVVKGGPA